MNKAGIIWFLFLATAIIVGLFIEARTFGKASSQEKENGYLKAYYQIMMQVSAVGAVLALMILLCSAIIIIALR